MRGFQYHYALGLHFYHYHLLEGHLKTAYDHFSAALTHRPDVVDLYLLCSHCLIANRSIMSMRHAVAKQVAQYLIKGSLLAPDHPQLKALIQRMGHEYFENHGLKNPLKTLGYE